MFENYFEALEAAHKHNSALEPWEHERQMPVFHRETGEWDTVPTAGSYGTFENPIVLLGGRTCDLCRVA